MRMINRLLTSGMVTRRDNPANRREVLLGVTDEGRRLVRQVTAKRREEITRIVATMPETRRDELVMAMRAFAEAAHEPEPRPETTAALGW
jgi:DNA-binding MarR family transcriptional regulator